MANNFKKMSFEKLTRLALAFQMTSVNIYPKFFVRVLLQ